MPFGVHPGFLIILLIIVLIVFGPGKLPELGGAIGRGIREFRKESDKIIDEVKASTTEREHPSTATEVTRTEVTRTEAAPTASAEVTRPEVAPTAAAEATKPETERPS